MQQTLVSKQSGSALVIVVAFLALTAVCVLLGAGDFATKNNADRERDTLKKMNIISNAIAAYVQRYDRVPCPAAPNVLPTNAVPVTGFGYEARLPSGACSTVPIIGILPFRTLQLPESFSKDAFENYFTYAATPVFAVPNPGGPQHWFCRTSDWYSTLSGTAYRLNREKGAFCCPTALGVGDVIILGDRPGCNLVEPPNIHRGNNPPASYPAACPVSAAPVFNEYGAVTDGPAAIRVVTSIAGVTNPRGAVYALVSHGRNRLGAFRVDGTNNVLPGAVTFERENSRNGNRTFVSRNQSYSTNAANYFDDLVVYKNQYQIYSQLGGGTCSRAWR